MSIRVFQGLPSEPLGQACFLTIGNFDGVHRGHQALIAEMVAAAHAAGCQAGVLSFDPHPLAVLRPQVPLAYLTSIDERVNLLAAHGLDFMVVLPFTREVAATSAADFMAALSARLRLAALWVGPDFALGRGREGTPDRLAEIGAGLGYEVHMIQPFHDLGGPVHSSRIRKVLTEDGAAAEAAALLGRPYQVWGEVTHGAGRGRDLGYPTANLAVPVSRLVPAYGIYACWAWLGEDGREGHPAAVSIGVRPTFDNGAASVEAYLLDYRGDLYGQRMGLSFIERLRPEQRFPTVEALLVQMDADVAATRLVLQRSGGAGEQESAGEMWEEVRHTADWAVQVRGENQRELFGRAAEAMFALEAGGAGQPVTLARAVRMEADNPSELLVAWLNQLLFHQEVHGEMYSRFELHDLSARGLQGVAYGYRGAPAHTEVKAVTFWGLEVQETAAGWSATVTFDV